MRAHTAESKVEHRLREVHLREGMAEPIDDVNLIRNEEGNVARPIRHICNAWGRSRALGLSRRSTPSKMFS